MNLSMDSRPLSRLRADASSCAKAAADEPAGQACPSPPRRGRGVAQPGEGIRQVHGPNACAQPNEASPAPSGRAVSPRAPDASTSAHQLGSRSFMSLTKLASVSFFF